MYKTLNIDQEKYVNKIIDSIHGKIKNKIFYLAGSAGCGKTFIYNTIAYYCN